MKNMKTSMKLAVSFAVVIVLAILVGVVGMVGMRSLEASTNDLYKLNMQAIIAMGNLRTLFNQERNELRALYLSLDSPEKLKSTMDGFTAHEQTAAENFKLYESTIIPGTEGDEEAYYSAKKVYLGAFADMKRDTFALIEQGRYDEAYKIFIDRGAGIIPPIQTGFNESMKQNEEWAETDTGDAAALARQYELIQVGVLILDVLIAVFLAVYITGLIAKPLTYMAKMLNQIGSSGDLELDAETKRDTDRFVVRKDEIGTCVGAAMGLVRHMTDIQGSLERMAAKDLAADIKVLSGRDAIGLSVTKMADNLNEMFSEIQIAAAQVSTGSGQVADGAQMFAQGATQQAAAVEQLSASISEITRQTDENAEMASRALALSDSIRRNAEKGDRQMEQMVSAVQGISDASRRIGKVMKVIDDIAFQTNILALNAAVEAARAGQHGKGFAVVAEEVRSLAAKSAEAARDTGSIIADSVEKAELGARIAAETSASLSEIVQGINESGVIVGDMAKSSGEQAAAVAQISKGIEQVSQVVQQNSAAAEESAAASQQMNSQAGTLEEMVAEFKLKDRGSQWEATRLPPGADAHTDNWQY